MERIRRSEFQFTLGGEERELAYVAYRELTIITFSDLREIEMRCDIFFFFSLQKFLFVIKIFVYRPSLFFFEDTFRRNMRNI